MVGTAQVARLPSLVPGIYVLCQFLWLKSCISPVPKGTRVIDTLTQVRLFATIIIGFLKVCL